MLSYPYPRDYKLWYSKSLWTLCSPRTHNHTYCHATNKQTNKRYTHSPPLNPVPLHVCVVLWLLQVCSAQLLEWDAYCIGSMKMMEISTIATCSGSSEHIYLSLAKDKAGPCSANHKYDVACNKFLYSFVS